MQSLTLESATEKDARPLPRLMPRLHVKAFSGGAIVLIFIFMGIFGPTVAPHDPNKQELTAMMKAPAGHRRAARARHRQSRTRHPQPRDSWLPCVAAGRLCGGFRFGFYRHHARRDLRLFRRQSRFPDSKTSRSRLGFSAAAARHHDHGIFRPGLVQSDSGARGAALDPLLSGRARPDSFLARPRFRHRGAMLWARATGKSSRAILFRI